MGSAELRPPSLSPRPAPMDEVEVAVMAGGVAAATGSGSETTNAGAAQADDGIGKNDLADNTRRTDQIVVSSIGNTRTASGLEVHASLDENTYEKGIKVADDALAECIIKRHNFHGDWNYEIHPRKSGPAHQNLC